MQGGDMFQPGIFKSITMESILKKSNHLRQGEQWETIITAKERKNIVEPRQGSSNRREKNQGEKSLGERRERGRDRGKATMTNIFNLGKCDAIRTR